MKANKFICILIIFLAILKMDVLFGQIPRNFRDNLNRQQGLWHEIMTDGKKKYLYAICNYKDGKRNGQCDYYYDNGKMMSANFYINDTIDGERKVYRKDGTLFQIENFKMGVLHGFKKFYDNNGILHGEQEYKDGYAEGIYRGYYPNGRIAVEENRLKADSLSPIETHIMGALHGFKKIYDYNGKIREEQEYKNDHKDGVYRQYYPNGRIAIESYMINDKENGIRKVYEDSKANELIREFDFVNDIKVKARYYENGKVIKEETF